MSDADGTPTQRNGRTIVSPKSFRDMDSTVREGSITYARQNELPRLPIPTLEETMTKFVRTMSALQTERETEATKLAVQDFMEKEGPILQKALLDYDKKGFESGGFGSYIEEFWNESYLSPDSSLVLNLNPFFVLEGGVSAPRIFGSVFCFLSPQSTLFLHSTSAA
jgi:hypothetical protein